MPLLFSPSTMFFKFFFAHENMKKPASKVAKTAQIQPKSQFLFHKNLLPRDFSIMTLGSLALSQSFNEICGGKCSSTKCLTIISVTKGDHLKHRIISIMEFCIAGCNGMPLLGIKGGGCWLY